MVKSCVIIGGGLGGLVTACLLAEEGCKVTVLEKHNVIGGGLHCFKKHGVLFETGIHYISGFQEDGVLRKIFQYLKIFDKLNIKDLDKNAFDIVHFESDNQKYYMGVGKENHIALLVEKFPSEKENIRKYINAIYEMSKGVPLYNLKTENIDPAYFNEKLLVSTGDFIESFTSNKKLQAVLAWNNGLYGGEKYTTPIYIHALITKFYIEGASRFVNGSQQLADAMTDYIHERGGTVLTSSEVTQINVEDKKIIDVVTSDGRKYNGEYYISDIHPATLFNIIDPAKIQRSYRERLSNIDNTYSVFTVFVVFKPNTFKFLNSVYYYYNDYDEVWSCVSYLEENFPPGFMLLTPPKTNQGEYAEKAIINCMIKFDRVKEWQHTSLGKREQSYLEFKNNYQNKILEKVNTVFDGFIDSIDHVFSATPLTVRDYLGTKDGSLYGYKKDCNDIVKSRIMPTTKLKNLLLTGQNLNLHGILGVPLSSIVTAGVLFGQENIVNKINETKFVK